MTDPKLSRFRALINTAITTPSMVPRVELMPHQLTWLLDQIELHQRQYADAHTELLRARAMYADARAELSRAHAASATADAELSRVRAALAAVEQRQLETQRHTPDDAAGDAPVVLDENTQHTTLEFLAKECRRIAITGNPTFRDIRKLADAVGVLIDIERHRADTKE